MPGTCNMRAINTIKWTIRTARVSEADVLSDLAFRSKGHWGYSEAFMEACRDELTYTREQIASDRYRFALAEAAGKLVGFYALRRVSPSEVELEALFVDPNDIGKGCGRALVEHAKREAASMDASSMVIQGDPNAEPFYRATGGMLIGRRESGSIRGRHLPLFQIDLTRPPAPL